MSPKGLTNEQVVLLAVAQLGGDVSSIDTEDVAIQADKIAPKRFRWRKYAQFINNELVHTSLRDAKNSSGLLRGSNTHGWQMTSKGKSLAIAIDKAGIKSTQPRRSASKSEKAWAAREKQRILREPAIVKYFEGKLGRITRAEAERFFGLNDYITGNARDERVQRFKHIFEDDPDLGDVVQHMGTLI